MFINRSDKVICNDFTERISAVKQINSVAKHSCNAYCNSK